MVPTVALYDSVRPPIRADWLIVLSPGSGGGLVSSSAFFFSTVVVVSADWAWARLLVQASSRAAADRRRIDRKCWAPLRKGANVAARRLRGNDEAGSEGLIRTLAHHRHDVGSIYLKRDLGIGSVSPTGEFAARAAVAEDLGQAGLRCPVRFGC